MSEDNLYNKVLDDLISYAGPIAIKEMADNMEEPEDVEFSKEHQKKMEHFFRKERNKLRFKKLSSYSKRVAACIFALIIVASVSVLSVEAWRIKFLNLIIDINQTYTDINLKENAAIGGAYHSDIVSLDYIPEGFKLEKSDMKENHTYLKFKKNEQYFNFTMDNADGSISVDTENANVKRIMINNQEAIYSSNENINILVWHDAKYFCELSGNISEKEIIKIAGSIKK